MSQTELQPRLVGPELDPLGPAEPAAPGAGVQLPELARMGLGQFAAVFTGLVLAGMALSGIWVGRTTSSVSPSLTAMIYGLTGLACIAAGLAPRRQAWQAWLARVARVVPLVATTGVLMVTVWLRMSARESGPTSAEAVLAGLVLLSAAVAFGAWVGLALTAILAWLGLGQALMLRPADPVTRTALSGALMVVQLVLAGGVACLIVIGFRRSAARAALAAAKLDEGLAQDRAAAAAQIADAEAARTVHDTALNTLEAISKGGAALDADQVRRRCLQDLVVLRRWRAGGVSQDLATSLEDLADHAHALGLELEVGVTQTPDRTALPPQVTHAFHGAARESITNVAKHAGVSRAELAVRHDSGGLAASVSDTGVGTAGASGPGFGLAESVEARMASVGGEARIRSGPHGAGTRVELSWRAATLERFDLEPVDLNLLAARVFMVAGLTATFVSLAVIALGWTSFQRPFVAVSAAVIPAVALVGLVRGAKAGQVLPPAATVAAVAIYVAVTFAAPLADPYCSSLTGERAGLDARLFLLATAVLFLPQLRIAAAVALTVLVANFAAGVLWQEAFPLCGSGTRTAGFAAAGALMAIWWFGRIASGLSTSFGQARTETLAVRVRTSCSEQARLERQRWARDALAGSERILVGLVDGDMSLGDQGVARNCSGEASFLRGMLMVGRARSVPARTLRHWMGELRRAGFQVVVRGSYAQFDPPPAVSSEIEAVVAAVVRAGGPGEVSFLGWGDATGNGLSIEALHPGGSDLMSHVGARTILAPRIQAGLVDSEPGALTVVWDWPPAQLPPDDATLHRTGLRR